MPHSLVQNAPAKDTTTFEKKVQCGNYGCNILPLRGTGTHIKNSPKCHFTVKSKRVAGQTGKLVRRSRGVREHRGS